MEYIRETEDDRRRRLLTMAVAFRGLQRLRRRRENLRNLRRHQRRMLNAMYVARDSEGVMEVLVNRHLRADDKKFKEYFRLSIEIFDFVLRHVERDITCAPSNFVPLPITPETKLAITIR